MIIITEKWGEITVNLPKTTSKNAPFYNLMLYSETNIKYRFEGLENISDNPNYYTFEIDFEDVADGEYKYEVEGYKPDFGIMRIGDITPSVKENNKENKIIQYGE